MAILFALSSPNFAYGSPWADSDGAEDDYFEDFYGDEDFVSIATGTKKSVHKAPAVATVISADDIHAMGANTIHQVIETVTGIHTYPSNINRMNPSYSIRGIHTPENSQVLVLVNGVRTTYEFTGAKWNIFDVGVNLIDRIEIIRGPGSAVYGADAYSGVINIITKGNDAVFENDVGVKAGSFDSKNAWFNYGYQQDNIKFSANAQWQDSAGDSSRVVPTDLLHLIGQSEISNAPGPLDTRHRYTDIHMQLTVDNWYASLWYLDLEGGTGAGAAQALSNNDTTSGEQIAIQTGYKKQLSADFDIDVNLQFQQYKAATYFEIFPAGYIDAAGVNYTEGYIGNPLLEDTNYQARVTSNYSGFAKHKIRLEFGYKDSEETTDEFKNFGPGIISEGQTEQDGTLTSVKGTEHIFIGDNTRQLSYLSLQDEWLLSSDWELTAGVRYDHYSDFGSTINPRLALVWQTRHNLTTKLLYGSAFRAPSFGDLYATNNPVKLGNPDLKPEQIDTWDLAFDYRPSYDWQVLFNIYQYQASELLAYVDNQLENSSKQDGIGSELEIRWQPSDTLKVKMGYAWQDAKDANNHPIADAPQHSIDASIQWQITEDINIYSDTYWISNRYRAPLDSRNHIDDYNWTNLSMHYDGIEHINLTLTVRNLFNSDAREASNGRIVNDYPLEERGFWLTGRYSF